MGDKTPGDESIKCDNQFCGTQLVGTGRTAKDVVIDNKFSKLNGIRADRVSGIVTAQLHGPAVGVQRRVRARDRRFH